MLLFYSSPLRCSLLKTTIEPKYILNVPLCYLHPRLVMRRWQQFQGSNQDTTQRVTLFFLRSKKRFPRSRLPHLNLQSCDHNLIPKPIMGKGSRLNNHWGQPGLALQLVSFQKQTSLGKKKEVMDVSPLHSCYPDKKTKAQQG